MLNMTWCFEFEEETNDEGVSKENFSGKADKIVDALNAMPICLNCEQIFSLPNETCQHMVIALQHPEIYAEKVKGAVEMSEMPIKCASYNTVVRRWSTIGLQTSQSPFVRG